MPLRGFIYLARIYQNYIKQIDANIYGKTLIPLPVPKYVVFYNGNQTEADYQELCLSDAFLPTESSEEKPAVECRALWEYAYFVNEVKENLKNGGPIENAVAEARKACIDKDILKEFLEKNSSEVEDVILEEFDREWYEKKVREESQRIGVEEGRNEELSRIAEDEKLREELYREYGL